MGKEKDGSCAARIEREDGKFHFRKWSAPVIPSTLDIELIYFLREHPAPSFFRGSNTGGETRLDREEVSQVNVNSLGGQDIKGGPPNETGH